MNILYTAEAVVEGGRAGHGRTSDGRLAVELSVPQEMGGAGGPGTNPEQLFAVGYAACFQSALMSVARGRKLDTSDSTITARVGIGPTGHGGFGLTVALDVHVPRLSRGDAEDLMRRAHERCPYSNATRGNIDVTLSVDGIALDRSGVAFATGRSVALSRANHPRRDHPRADRALASRPSHRDRDADRLSHRAVDRDGAGVRVDPGRVALGGHDHGSAAGGRRAPRGRGVLVPARHSGDVRGHGPGPVGEPSPVVRIRRSDPDDGLRGGLRDRAGGGAMAHPLRVTPLLPRVRLVPHPVRPSPGVTARHGPVLARKITDAGL